MPRSYCLSAIMLLSIYFMLTTTNRVHCGSQYYVFIYLCIIYFGIHTMHTYPKEGKLLHYLYTYVILTTLKAEVPFDPQKLSLEVDPSQNGGSASRTHQHTAGENKVITPKQQFLCIILFFICRYLKWPWQKCCRSNLNFFIFRPSSTVLGHFSIVLL